MSMINSALFQVGQVDAMMFSVYIFLVLCFVYALVVSYQAYREAGKKFMLYLPRWIDASSGVSRPLRRHGVIAFTLLFIAMILFFNTLEPGARQ
ncbi:MAG: hypothetical protein GY802_03500 [Gammaproteobacteria bacterium]|nr:hypothetical protein [Gammaproteobacteria bacterium]